MIYKYKLLKDLPDVKAGTTEIHREAEKCWITKLFEDHPGWVSKEIYSEACLDLSCPKCGQKTMQAEHESFLKHSDDVYYRYVTVDLICECGHRLNIGTFLAKSKAYDKYI